MYSYYSRPKLSPKYDKNSNEFTNKDEQLLSSKSLNSTISTRLGEKVPTVSNPTPIDPYNFKFLSLEEEAFQDFIRELVSIGSEIELAKSDLSLRPDFNLSDAFRIFETNKLENISDLDFKLGLNFLELFPLMEEVVLVFNHYKKRGAKLLSYNLN